MKDSMTAYTALAACYRELPLVALRELESILHFEITQRVNSFLNVGDEKSLSEALKRDFVQENNVIKVEFGRGKK